MAARVDQEIERNRARRLDELTQDPKKRAGYQNAQRRIRDGLKRK